MKRFKHKETGKIGEVVHDKGVTTTLRFEDGSEQIITPANLKRWWVEIDDVNEPENVEEKVLGAINDYIDKALGEEPNTEKKKRKKDKLENAQVNKLSWNELKELFITHNEETKEDSKKAVNAIVVFSQDNFKDEYTEEQRSYRVSSNNKAFQHKSGNSIFMSCLDGSDDNVRFDWYNWKVDYCYLEK